MELRHPPGDSRLGRIAMRSAQRKQGRIWFGQQQAGDPRRAGLPRECPWPRTAEGWRPASCSSLELFSYRATVPVRERRSSIGVRRAAHPHAPIMRRRFNCFRVRRGAIGVPFPVQCHAKRGRIPAVRRTLETLIAVLTRPWSDDGNTGLLYGDRPSRVGTTTPCTDRSSPDRWNLHGKSAPPHSDPLCSISLSWCRNLVGDYAAGPSSRASPSLRSTRPATCLEVGTSPGTTEGVEAARCETRGPAGLSLSKPCKRS